MPPSSAWKLGLAAILLLAIVASACARAPRRRVAGRELRRLVLCALLLYAIGAVASLHHYPALSALVYGTGISVAALAAWLSRGRDQEDPPDDGGGQEPVDEHPPPEPDGLPGLDWASFERDFRAYARHAERERRSRPVRP